MASSFFGKNGSALLRFARQMIVLPGPAFVVIPLGLGILAVEFRWARRLLDRVRHEGRKALPARWQWLFGKYESKYEEREKKKQSHH